MSDTVKPLLERIADLEEELQNEYDRRREELISGFEGGRAVFEAELLERQRALRTKLLHYIIGARGLVVLTAPLIYALIVPFVFLDAMISLYQAICFPVYGLEKVRRSDFIAIDRHRLQYLNLLERLNCIYCGYGNGLLAYVTEVAARTESHWCPIKHARRVEQTHRLYAGFTDYGDAEAYHEHRAALKKRGGPPR